MEEHRGFEHRPFARQLKALSAPVICGLLLASCLRGEIIIESGGGVSGAGSESETLRIIAPAREAWFTSTAPLLVSGTCPVATEGATLSLAVYHAGLEDLSIPRVTTICSGGFFSSSLNIASATDGANEVRVRYASSENQTRYPEVGGAFGIDTIGTSTTVSSLWSCRLPGLPAIQTIAGVNYTTLTSIPLSCSRAPAFPVGSPETILLFSDSGCTTLTSSATTALEPTGSAAVSTSWVIPPAQREASGTQVYFKIRDAVGHVSDCGSLGEAPGGGSLLLIAHRSLVVSPKFEGAPHWNQYVRKFSSAVEAIQLPSDATLSPPCSDTEVAGAGGPTACLPGGEFRKVSLASCVADCTPPLTFNEQWASSGSQGILDWRCTMIDGVPFAVSAGFLPQKGLGDLLLPAGSGAPDWKALTFQVTGCDLPGAPGVQRSIEQAWWSNPVVDAPSSVASPQPLGTAGKIYTVRTDQTSLGYEIQDDRVALVVLPHVTLSLDAAAPSNCDNLTLLCLVHGGGRKFSWVEGKFQIPDIVGGASPRGIFFANGAFNRVHHVTVQNDSNPAFRQGYGIETRSETKFRGTELAISGGAVGVLLGSGTQQSSVVGLRADSQRTNGLWLNSSGASGAKNTVQDIWVSRSVDNGVLVTNSIANLSRITAVEALADGIRIAGTSVVRASNLAALFNGALGIQVLSAAAPTSIADLAMVAAIGNAPLPQVSALPLATFSLSGNVLVNADVFPFASQILGQDSGHNLVVFEGEDSSIMAGPGGSSAFFPAFPAPPALPSLIPFNPSLLFNHTLLFGINGDDFNDLPDRNCPASFDTSLTTGPLSGVLLAASEIVGDGRGNEDGLCEAFESCVYTPHFGAYQGTGPLKRCDWSGGARAPASNTTLYYY